MPSTDRVAKVVLVDIEGTTTSISFVHDVLFPYAKNNVKKFLAEGWESSSEIKQIVHTFRVPPTEMDVQIIAGFVRYLIDKDLKVTPLKTLQGLIWQQGYETGELRGHVFEDVPGAFAAWREAGLRIAVYSSGSVAAQKLIFKYSIAGDLLTHLSAHFDTHVGHKQETQSYVNIAKSLGEDPRNILFLTDIPGEAAAARAAGLQAIMLQRPGNAPLTDDQKSGQELIADFSSLHSLQLPE
ncbi:enolase-phosphatase E1 isoform X2 [Drosophila subobscura]|uniref:enolase-phosphatase E1 isoform X2 n=1 Tax=Drosophila subobscura TaxID=7241 RepID=UPI00155AD3DC|nr:enolase-phosphatase E1 isoform X2 [Drosophila subobscura]